MLDFRHETFLALCKIGHYTKTAEYLHITQPAVSQHIKFLEDYYGCKLFEYKDKQLTLTPRGERLREFALSVSADSRHLREMLCNENLRIKELRFGATLSIGEFVCPPLMAHLLRTSPHMHVNMLVDNTQVLLQKLQDGHIDFAFIEGYFDKSAYNCALFSMEDFIAVCGKEHPLAQAQQEVTLQALLSQRIILRERGSGTRDVFEQLLHEHHLSVNSFEKVCQLGNMSAIKRLVAENLGITFLYKVAAQAELDNGTLKMLNVQGFPFSKPFHFVYLQNSLHEKEYMGWLSYFKRKHDQPHRQEPPASPKEC